MVKDNKLPIFGVNTDPSRSVGHLTSIKIPFESRHREIPQLIDYVEKENFKYLYKQRIKLEKKDFTTNLVKTTFALNEVFVAERNVGVSSIYRIKADGEYIGKFKSSGLLMCTGTGSTGWLQSAKRTTDGDVLSALNHLGFASEGEEVVHTIALDLSKETAFELDRPELFYYVREPQISGDFERHAQGFAKSIEFMSDQYDGMVSVDGLLNV